MLKLRGHSKNIFNELKIVFNSGSIFGLVVVSVRLLGISFLYFIFRDSEIIYGFGFGASLVALFARAGINGFWGEILVILIIFFASCWLKNFKNYRKSYPQVRPWFIFLKCFNYYWSSRISDLCSSEHREVTKSSIIFRIIIFYSMPGTEKGWQEIRFNKGLYCQKLKMSNFCLVYRNWLPTASHDFWQSTTERDLVIPYEA